MNAGQFYDGGPAFPREDYQADEAPWQRGMSLRDYFAAKAMQGFIAGGCHVRYSSGSGITEAEFIAGISVAFADALIAKLAKTGAK